jgi:cobalt-zinc-cadmium efflux system membrane fusion protein
MKHWIVSLTVLLLVACGAREEHAHPDGAHEDHASATAQEVAKGPNGGRLLANGPFAIELAIFETGVPPEYHAWPTLEGQPLPLDQVDLTVELTRLGGNVDRFRFTPQGEYLRGDGVVSEPHSFVVNVRALHAGKTHAWQYDSFEGRTTIPDAIAREAGIETEVAGAATLLETLPLYGRIIPDPARHREVSARFPGLIRAVHRKPGDAVRTGETLATVESNQSLETYAVTAPISGVVATRDANVGEQSGDRTLFTIVDPSAVWAELSVFPRDRARVRPGAAVTIRLADSEAATEGRIERVDVQAGANQAVTARASLPNPGREFLPGSFVTAEVAVAEREVPLAVRQSALQPFRDFTVVFEKIGETYEVRMLDLGSAHGGWVEVLGGLEPGAHYVTQNSYVIKADVEKSGASHDH